jgi:hypothetical protein
MPACVYMFHCDSADDDLSRSSNNVYGQEGSYGSHLIRHHFVYCLSILVQYNNRQIRANPIKPVLSRSDCTAVSLMSLGLACSLSLSLCVNAISHLLLLYIYIRALNAIYSVYDSHCCWPHLQYTYASRSRG